MLVGVFLNSQGFSVTNVSDDICVNNKMLEYDEPSLMAKLAVFRSKLSDLTCSITNICNQTGQIGRHLIPLAKKR